MPASYRFIAFALVGLMSNGCASVMSKSVYSVAIESYPANANFVVTDHKGKTVASGTTPQTVSLRAKRAFGLPANYSVNYSAPGHQSIQRQVKADMDGFVFGNILVGGIPGLIVDAGTGAMFELPDSVSGSLSGGASYSQNDTSQPVAGGEIQPAGFSQPK